MSSNNKENIIYVLDSNGSNNDTKENKSIIHLITTEYIKKKISEVPKECLKYIKENNYIIKFDHIVRRDVYFHFFNNTKILMAHDNFIYKRFDFKIDEDDGYVIYRGVLCLNRSKEIPYEYTFINAINSLIPKYISSSHLPLYWPFDTFKSAHLKNNDLYNADFNYWNSKMYEEGDVFNLYDFVSRKLLINRNRDILSKMFIDIDEVDGKNKKVSQNRSVVCKYSYHIKHVNLSYLRGGGIVLGYPGSGKTYNLLLTIVKSLFYQQQQQHSNNNNNNNYYTSIDNNMINIFVLDDTDYFILSYFLQKKDKESAISIFLKDTCVCWTSDDVFNWKAKNFICSRTFFSFSKHAKELFSNKKINHFVYNDVCKYGNKKSLVDFLNSSNIQNVWLTSTNTDKKLYECLWNAYNLKKVFSLDHIINYDTLKTELINHFSIVKNSPCITINNAPVSTLISYPEGLPRQIMHDVFLNCLNLGKKMTRQILICLFKIHAGIDSGLDELTELKQQSDSMEAKHSFITVPEEQFLEIQTIKRPRYHDTCVICSNDEFHKPIRNEVCEHVLCMTCCSAWCQISEAHSCCPVCKKQYTERFLMVVWDGMKKTEEELKIGSSNNSNQTINARTIGLIRNKLKSILLQNNNNNNNNNIDSSENGTTLIVTCWRENIKRWVNIIKSDISAKVSSFDTVRWKNRRRYTRKLLDNYNFIVIAPEDIKSFKYCPKLTRVIVLDLNFAFQNWTDIYWSLSSDYFKHCQKYFISFPNRLNDFVFKEFHKLHKNYNKYLEHKDRIQYNILFQMKRHLTYD